MKKLIIANWKMNPKSDEEAIALARAVEKGIAHLGGVTAVIAPPFPFLGAVHAVLDHTLLGAQDVFWEESGAYTGEVSAHELREVGVRYVIIGHSERRAMGESNVVVNKKLRAVLEEGLTAVLCVGEPKKVRVKGTTAAQSFVKRQLEDSMKGIKNWKSGIEDNVIIAYEPVWAIGTGEEDDPKDVAEMAEFIKKTLKPITQNLTPQVLYGGSTDAANVAGYIETGLIDGALVGGASLKASEFIAMARNIERVSETEK